MAPSFMEKSRTGHGGDKDPENEPRKGFCPLGFFDIREVQEKGKCDVVEKERWCAWGSVFWGGGKNNVRGKIGGWGKTTLKNREKKLM